MTANLLGYKKFTYFFGEPPFSQWYKCDFVVDDVWYNCTEQYMMAEKARLFSDEDQLREIMEASDPNYMKLCGKRVMGFKKDVWESNAKYIVRKGNFSKFMQNRDAREKLLRTEGTLLVEASPYDTIWGIGIDMVDAKKGVPWRGKNWLGEVLTLVRDELLKAGFDYTVKLKSKKYKRLLKRDAHLRQLEIAGVDNWEGYRGLGEEDEDEDPA